MTDAEAIEALNDFIDNPDDREEQRGAARSALLVLRKSLHNAQNRAEMVCHQEPCGDCPGCARADDLGGDPMADWTGLDDGPIREPLTDITGCDY